MDLFLSRPSRPTYEILGSQNSTRNSFDLARDVKVSHSINGLSVILSGVEQ